MRLNDLGEGLIRMVCGWCKKDLGTKDDKKGDSSSPPKVSHGICKACGEAMFAGDGGEGA